jgi:hypothetical protein
MLDIDRPHGVPFSTTCIKQGFLSCFVQTVSNYLRTDVPSVAKGGTQKLPTILSKIVEIS